MKGAGPEPLTQAQIDDLEESASDIVKWPPYEWWSETRHLEAASHQMARVDLAALRTMLATEPAIDDDPVRIAQVRRLVDGAEAYMEVVREVRAMMRTPVAQEAIP